MGENGSGKSTLLEGFAVAHGFNPEGEQRIVLIMDEYIYANMKKPRVIG